MGKKDLYLQLAHPGPLQGRQVTYSACLSAVPQLLGWRWVYGKGSNVCALPQEDEQHAHNPSELFGGSTKLNRDRYLRDNQTLHVLS